MNGIRRHVEIQREKRKAQENAAGMLMLTLMAIATRRWNVDGAADPEGAIERLQKSLLTDNAEAMVDAAEELSEIITVAVRAGDFTPYTAEEHKLIAMAENVFEGVLDRKLALPDLLD